MSGGHPPEQNPVGQSSDPLNRRADADELTDTGFNRAYSAPESEQYAIAPYIPSDIELYDYDSYESAGDTGGELPPPRWPCSPRLSRAARPPATCSTATGTPSTSFSGGWSTA